MQKLLISKVKNASIQQMNGENATYHQVTFKAITIWKTYYKCHRKESIIRHPDKTQITHFVESHRNTRVEADFVAIRISEKFMS